MMVQGRHAKKALFRAFENENLKHNGNSLDHVNASEGEDQERIFKGKAHSRNQRAEKKRARISHEDLCGMKIENQKSNAGTYSRR